jgi:bifunctional non-homologous end joining protein LigD
MPKSRSAPAKAAKTNGRDSPSRARRSTAQARHALVGGWSQRRGDFVSLLLGVRQGRRRKLTYIGEVRIDPDGLAMTLLEPRLRASEIESSPFVEKPPDHRDHTHHWIDPDLVAEIEFDSWTRQRTIADASLRAVTGRTAFRRAKWVVPPKGHKPADL